MAEPNARPVEQSHGPERASERPRAGPGGGGKPTGGPAAQRPPRGLLWALSQSFYRVLTAALRSAGADAPRIEATCAHCTRSWRAGVVVSTVFSVRPVVGCFGPRCLVVVFAADDDDQPKPLCLECATREFQRFGKGEWELEMES